MQMRTEGKLKKHEQSMQDLWDTTERLYLLIMDMKEGEQEKLKAPKTYSTK
jgi:hypothetical protein